MQMSLRFLIVILLCFQSVLAQPIFEKLIRSSATHLIQSNSKASVVATLDSAIIVVYNSIDTGGTDIYLRKFSNNGVQLWERQILLPGQLEILTDAVQMRDSNITILATYDLGSKIYDEEVLMFKLSLDGNLVSTNFLTNTGICCWDIADGRLTLDLRGRLIHTHQSFGISFSLGIIQVIDTNYATRYSGNGGNVLYHATAFQDIDSSYMSFGHETVRNGRRAALSKRNKNFGFVWQKFYRHPAIASTSITYTSDALREGNSYFLLMQFKDTIGNNQLYFIKTNLNGDTLKTKTLSSNLWPLGMYALGSNDFLVAGSQLNTLGNERIEVFRMDSNFNITASRTFGNNNFKERLWSFKPAGDGTFLLAASADSGNYRNIHLLKIKPNLCLDPRPSFAQTNNAGQGPGIASVVLKNTSNYGIIDSLNTQAVIFFGDGDSANFYVDSITHIYAVQGNYTVVLRVTTPCGTKIFSKVINVPCAGQAQAFTQTKNLLTVNFNYPHAASSYQWSFGDGAISSGAQVTHTYALAGTYLVCLNTNNACGAMQFCDSVKVECTAPVVNLTSLINACAGQTITLDAANPGASYLWSDGQTTQRASFVTTGLYTVEVTNICGAKTIASTRINFNAKPQPYIGPDTVICVNEQLLLTNLNPTGNYSYQWFEGNSLRSSGTAYSFAAFTYGLYDITLVANNNGCLDTVTRLITAIPALLCDTTSYTLPTYTAGTTQGDYIKRVAIGTINNVSGGINEPSYVDYTHLSANLSSGQSLTLTLEFNEVNPMYYRIWVDYNQDGIFSNTEILISGAVNNGTSNVFTSLGTAYGGPTRMRVRCASATSSNIDPVANYIYGQTEDYTLNILNGNGAPRANFKADTNRIYAHRSVDFTDLSTNNASAWQWTFAGATTPNVTQQNPQSILYHNPGCYPVVLRVANANGFGIKIDTCYIQVDLNIGESPSTNGNYIQAVPNPFGGVLNLVYGINQAVDLEIIDSKGSLLTQIKLQAYKNEQSIDLGFLQPGVYFLRAYSAKEYLTALKLIKY